MTMQSRQLHSRYIRAHYATTPPTNGSTYTPTHGASNTYTASQYYAPNPLCHTQNPPTGDIKAGGPHPHAAAVVLKAR